MAPVSGASWAGKGREEDEAGGLKEVQTMSNTPALRGG